MADEEKKDGTNDTSTDATPPEKKRLSGKKAIKDALNKGGNSSKAARMRKARKRNELRADAYHAAKNGSIVPMRVKIMIGLVIVAGVLLMVNKYRTVQEDRAVVDDVYKAAKNGDYAAVRKFLNSRPEFVDVPDAENNTLMHYGAMAGSVEICRDILELNGEIGRPNNNRRLPIHFAAENGSAEIVQMLINRDSYVTLSDKDGMQPIHLAARHGSADVIRMLLSSRAKVNAATKAKRIKEGEGAVSVSPEVQGALKIKVNTVSSFLMTPLHHAVQGGNIDAVKALLEFNPNLKALNSHGYTALHIAVICKKKEIARHLIAAGASPHWASRGTNTALDLALKSEDKEIEKILLTPMLEIKAYLEEKAAVSKTKAKADADKDTPKVKTVLETEKRGV